MSPTPLAYFLSCDVARKALCLRVTLLSFLGALYCKSLCACIPYFDGERFLYSIRAFHDKSLIQYIGHTQNGTWIVDWLIYTVYTVYIQYSIYTVYIQYIQYIRCACAPEFIGTAPLRWTPNSKLRAIICFKWLWFTATTQPAILSELLCILGAEGCVVDVDLRFSEARKLRMVCGVLETY